jgi:hypothetical protein
MPCVPSKLLRACLQVVHKMSDISDISTALITYFIPVYITFGAIVISIKM